MHVVFTSINILLAQSPVNIYICCFFFSISLYIYFHRIFSIRIIYSGGKMFATPSPHSYCSCQLYIRIKTKVKEAKVSQHQSRWCSRLFWFGCCHSKLKDQIYNRVIYLYVCVCVRNKSKIHFNYAQVFSIWAIKWK